VVLSKTKLRRLRKTDKNLYRIKKVIESLKVSGMLKSSETAFSVQDTL
jgi:hypothetical protein